MEEERTVSGVWSIEIEIHDGKLEPVRDPALKFDSAEEKL